MNTSFKTERLKLRPINLNDAAFILNLVNSKGWLKFIGDRNISDYNDSENYIKRILSKESNYYTIIELKNSSKAIGIVTFLEREDEMFPDLGFALLPEYESNGYAFEASKSYLEKIISLNKYKNIIAITMPDNKRSIALLTKLGLYYMDTYKKGKEYFSYYGLIKSLNS